MEPRFRDGVEAGRTTQEEDSQMATLTALIVSFFRLAGNHNQTILRG
jgi:hypothetical protein